MKKILGIYLLSLVIIISGCTANEDNTEEILTDLDILDQCIYDEDCENYDLSDSSIELDLIKFIESEIGTNVDNLSMFYHEGSFNTSFYTTIVNDKSEDFSYEFITELNSFLTDTHRIINEYYERSDIKVFTSIVFSNGKVESEIQDTVDIKIVLRGDADNYQKLIIDYKDSFEKLLELENSNFSIGIDYYDGDLGIKLRFLFTNIGENEIKFSFNELGVSTTVTQNEIMEFLEFTFNEFDFIITN